MTAAEPNRSRTSSSAASSARRRQSNGSASWTRVVVLEVGERDADEREPLRSRSAASRREQLRAAPRGSSASALSPEAACASGSRARSRRSAAAARPCGRRAAAGAQPAADPVDEADQRRVDLLGRLRARARARAARRSSGGAGRSGPAAGRGCAPARGGAGPMPGRASRRAPPRRASATWPTVLMPRSWSFAAVTGPTPQSRSTGSGWRNSSSPSGGTTSRPSGLATPLATLARNFVRATPTVIGSPTSSSTPRPQLARRSPPAARDRSQPADVEERLVDREPLDERRRVVEHREHGLARLGVGRHPRRHDDRVGAQPPRLPPAHRGPDAVRLGLVARREHDSAADDHGPPAQARHRRAARPTRRTRRDRHAGSSPRRTRTYVRTAPASYG